ncbi:hypothetical protein JHL17_07205 [Azospirillum sp. YIM B02556]|uniref:Uncharacterized protein n=1 Tax=Azospirillum endophyticum TaxID=2800326 RepID=A0ABS1F1C3_9PROT|nr:hypothetical protein [Azospirillum endophyticum]MBK1837196.1 hypothetical protein [Azospirillum endophyticum]
MSGGERLPPRPCPATVEAERSLGRLPNNVSGTIAGQLGLDRGMVRGLRLRTGQEAQEPV